MLYACLGLVTPPPTDVVDPVPMDQCVPLERCSRTGFGTIRKRLVPEERRLLGLVGLILRVGYIIHGYRGGGD